MVGELQGVEVRTEGVVMEVEEGLIAEAGVVCACDLCDYQAGLWFTNNYFDVLNYSDLKKNIYIFFPC